MEYKDSLVFINFIIPPFTFSGKNFIVGDNSSHRGKLSYIIELLDYIYELISF